MDSSSIILIQKTNKINKNLEFSSESYRRIDKLNISTCVLSPAQ